MPVEEEESLLDREGVLNALGTALRGLPFVHALWEGGAAAAGTLDEWSDLDVYLLVDDGKEDEAFSAVDDALSGISPVTLKLPIPQTGWDGVYQAFYKLAKMSEYQIIDLAIVTMSAEEKFLEPTVHGQARFIFNKLERIDSGLYDEDAARRKMDERRRRLADRLEMFGPFFQKEINRGNLIEAVDLYHRLVLPTLVELLRMRHYPAHHGFGTRHVHAELPKKVTERLVPFYLVRDEQDLVAKHREARAWIGDLLSGSE